MMKTTIKIIGCGMTLLLAPVSAPAAVVLLPQTIDTAGGAQWEVRNFAAAAAYSGGCGGSGVSIDDAHLPGLNAFDAYDVGFPLFVDDVLFNPGSTVDLTGTTLSTASAMMSGLEVRMQYHFADGLNAARILASFTNHTVLPISVDVAVPVNFGSDGGTIVQGTSSGDLSFDVSDRWVVTSDGGPFDPVNTIVFYGSGSPPVLPYFATNTVFSCAGTQGVGMSFEVAVPPGQSRSLMFFAGLGSVIAPTNTVAGALAAAPLFDDLPTIPAELLTGVALQNVVNWNYLCGNGVVDVGEECDDGNYIVGDCCTPNCTRPNWCMTGFGAASLLAKEKVPGKEKVLVKMLKGPVSGQAVLGNPVTGSTAYHLCVWDDVPRLVATYTVDRATDVCSGGSTDCWRYVGKASPDGKGYAYKDKDAASDGVTLLNWIGAASGKSQVLVKGKGSNLPSLAGALQTTTGVTLQIHSSTTGFCAETTLSEVKKQTATVFQAK